MNIENIRSHNFGRHQIYVIEKATQIKVRVPDCFYSGGYSGEGHAYLNAISEYAK